MLASVAVAWALISFGAHLHPETVAAPTIRRAPAAHSANPIVLLLAQVAVILALSRLLGMLCARLRQPLVIGEILAGIMLGPSLFGWVAPELFGSFFPQESVRYLGVLSQVGVILFLFLIGLELDPRLLRGRGHAALLISHASIALPFILGVGLTLYLYPRFFRMMPGMQFVGTALFMGAAMSVTAFPVLARILTERNLHKTDVGLLALTCAAIDDATAWCMLAFVIGIVRADGLVPGLITAAQAVAYVVFMFVAVRPMLRGLQKVYDHQGRLGAPMIGFILVLVLMSAWVTEMIGIHALFGAFLMGAMMPNGTKFVRAITDRLEDFTVCFLLPIFFAYAGLHTNIGLLHAGGLWLDTLLVIGVACLGKIGGSSLAAVVAGVRTRDALTIGVLMNTRGLMELVILEIGRAEGVLTPPVFAMMVIMALVTTGMTAPLLSLLARKTGAATTLQKPRDAILVPVAFPESGPALARLAHALLGTSSGQRHDPQLLPMHLVRPAEEQFGSGITELDEARDNALEPLLAEARRLGVPAEPISFVSQDIATDIAATARGRGASLVLMGVHRPVIGTEVLGGTVHRVFEQAEADVAVLIDRGFSQAARVLVPYLGTRHDRLALSLAERMSRMAGSQVTVLHVVRPGAAKLDVRKQVDETFPQPQPRSTVTLKVVDDAVPVDAVLREALGYDLVIVGVDEEWGLESHLFGWRPQRLAQACASSLLIVRRA